MKIADYKYIRELRKRRHERKKEHLQFESTSIGDMAFLLLIFFIVTGSFMLRQGIFFSLPSTSSGAVYVDPALIVDVWPEHEGFRIDGEVYSRNELKDLLTNKMASSDETVVLVNMRDDIAYDRMVDTLSVTKESGVIKVSLKNHEGDFQ